MSHSSFADRDATLRSPLLRLAGSTGFFAASLAALANVCLGC